MNRRILLIEDSDSVRRLIREQLARERLEWYEASDGATGLTYCRALRPALVLLDLHLPVLNGYEVLRRMQEDPETRSIPSILISGQATIEERVRGLDLGAVDFVIKPFSAIELRARSGRPCGPSTCSICSRSGLIWTP